MLTTVKRIMQRHVINQIRLPRDIDAVVSINDELECHPELAGMSPDQVQAIWQSVIELYKTGMYPGISFSLRRHGHTVLSRCIGHAEGNGPQDNAYTHKRVMTTDTPICLYSSSKAMTAFSTASKAQHPTFTYIWGIHLSTDSICKGLLYIPSVFESK